MALSTTVSLCIFSRGSTVERVVDLQGEESRVDEDHQTSHTTDNPSYGTVQAATNVSPALSAQHHSHSYYGPGQTSPSYWPQQDQAWSSNYATPTSGTYDASYYGSAGAPVAGTAFDPNYYNAYSGYLPQWLATTGDPRAFVGTGTTFDALSDLPMNTSRRNAELYHFCEPETNNP